MKIKKIQIFSLVCLLACTGTFFSFSKIFHENTNRVDSESEISVQLLAEGKKTIPIYYQYEETWNTNIKLPVIVITNNGDNQSLIKEIDVVGKFKNKEVCRNRFYEEEITKLIEETNTILNSLISNPDNAWKVYNLKKAYGLVAIPKEGFQKENLLRKDEKSAVDLSTIYHFLYEGPTKVDEIIIELKLAVDGKDIISEYPVILTPFISTNNYIFPIKGSATVSRMSLNEANGHRGSPSSEFAIDIIDVRRLPGGELSSSSSPHSNNVNDYYIFDREVIAVGDGFVVALGNKWPNKWVEDPLKYSIERITDLTVKLIRQGVEFENAYIGNYVILDHRNGEFSAYVHLSENSITVKLRDEVKQGQVIAKVGNTANSTEPHLHFQLMDGRDYAAANGLPVMFKDLPTPLELVHDFVEVNTLIYSDYLYVFVK